MSLRLTFLLSCLLSGAALTASAQRAGLPRVLLAAAAYLTQSNGDAAPVLKALQAADTGFHYSARVAKADTVMIFYQKDSTQPLLRLSRFSADDATGKRAVSAWFNLSSTYKTERSAIHFISEGINRVSFSDLKSLFGKYSAGRNNGKTLATMTYYFSYTNPASHRVAKITVQSAFRQRQHTTISSLY